MFENFFSVVGVVTVVLIVSVLVVRFFGLIPLIIVGVACLLIARCSISNRHAFNTEYFEYQNVCNCCIKDANDTKIFKNELIAEIDNAGKV